MEDKLNVPLEDAELLAEVELTTNLIIAASEADEVLTEAQIDELLGLSPGTGEPEARSADGGDRATDPGRRTAPGESEVRQPDIPAQHRRSD